MTEAFDDGASPWDTFGNLLQEQWSWAAQMLALETAWLTSLWSLQGQLLSSGSPAEWPAWMVWHNGAEQLA